MSTLEPLSLNNRDTSLDVLRGFALAGVLFIFCASDVGSASGYNNTFLDELIAWPKYILIESRMYTMLIIVFGIGFHVQLEKANRKGASLVPAFSRRLLGLMLIGFIHAILLSTRDILMFYALAGIVLLLVRKASNRLLFVLILVLFFIQIPAAKYLFPNPWPEIRKLSQPNNYSDHVQYNWQFFKLYHQVYFIYIEMLSHFLFGFWIGKAGILQKLKTNKKLRRTLMFVSLASSIVLIPGYYFWLIKSAPGLYAKLNSPWQQFLFATGMHTVWQIWMLVSVTLYGTILIGLSISDKVKKWLKPLAAFGQMALSNYLIQSLILVPYLLLSDKYNNLPPFNGFILFLLVFTLELLFSSWWMTQYTLGPFEWLLRSITYWKWQPIKKPLQKQFDDKRQLITVSTPQYL